MCINWFQLRLLLNSNTLYRIEVTWDGYTMCFSYCSILFMSTLSPTLVLSKYSLSVAVKMNLSYGAANTDNCQSLDSVLSELIAQ